jgi:multiple sugar transport system substrate-binding protein/putative aldouronate transport system substrate-binding protein
MLYKKITAFILMAAMAISLASCASPNTNVPGATGEGRLAGVIPQQTVELVIYSQLANFSGRQIGWAAEILKEKFNVNIVIINEMDGTFQTRMENGNLGDIVIFGNDGNEYQDAVAAGMLLDWEEDGLLEDYGPYIYKYMGNALEKNRTISGGTVYGFGHNVAGSADNHEGFFYYPSLRWDLYQELGYPEINTLEDFIPVLEKMVELAPVSDVGTKAYGVSFFPDWDGNMVMMVKATAALYGYDEFHFGLYDTKTQTFEGALEPGGQYLRALKFYNTLFQKGLLDPDSMTQTFNDMIEKYTNGAAHFNIFEWMASPFNTLENMEAGKMMRPVAAKDQRNITYGLNVFGGNRVWSIGAKTHYRELCMTIIDWFSSPEGVLTYNYGPRGLCWDYDEDGNTFMTPLGLDAQQDEENTIINYGNYNGTYRDGQFQHNNTTWNTMAVNPESARGEVFKYEKWDSTLKNKFVYPIEQSWRDYTGFNSEDEYLERNGHISVSIGSQYSQSKRNNELETTWLQVAQCIVSGTWSAIYAASDAEFDSIVEKMISDAKAYGYDECIEWTLKEAEARKEAEDLAK